MRSVVNHPLLPSSFIIHDDRWRRHSAVFTVAGLELAQGHLSHEPLCHVFFKLFSSELPVLALGSSEGVEVDPGPHVADPARPGR